MLAQENASRVVDWGSTGRLAEQCHRERWILIAHRWTQLAATHKAETDESPDGQHSIRVADFFALLSIAGLVGNRHLPDFLAQPAQLCSHFRTEFETVTLQRNILEQGAAKYLVAS